MPTQRKRINLALRPDLQRMVEKDAELNCRALANQVEWVLDQHYLARKREAGLFNPRELGESGEKIPVFETPSPQSVAPVSKSHV